MCPRHGTRPRYSVPFQGFVAPLSRGRTRTHDLVMTFGRMRGSRLVLMGLIVGAFFTAEEVFMDLASGRGASARRDLANGLQFWLIWIALVPAIAIAVRRWPLNTSRVARPLIAHAGAA